MKPRARTKTSVKRVPWWMQGCRLILTVFAIVMLPSLLFAEDNPFGSGTPSPNSGDEGKAPPAQDDDNFFAPPPGAIEQQPPTTQNEPPPETPEPTENGRPSPNIQPSPGRMSQPPPHLPSDKRVSRTEPIVVPKPKTSAGKEAKQPAAPKLVDYLELDPAVKGFEVRGFDFPDRDIKDVVTSISKWTGKNFILDNKVRGKITIIGPSQVTLQEAYQAFLSALEANGLTTVQTGKFIRIIESAEARRAPVKTYTGDFAPKDDQFITNIFQLKYINADEVQREFRDLTTRQGKLFAYEPTNSIIITDTGSNIQRIREILNALDVKSFETSLHVLKIKNGSAKGIAEMLGEIYGDDKAKGAQRTGFRRNTLERTRGGGIISKIIPDEATNSLVVLANGAGFESLKKLVIRLDVRGTTGKIHVYYCSYAKAEDLAQTLQSLAGGGSSGGAKRSKGGAGPGGGLGGAPAGGGGPVSAELEGGVKITSDAPTNSLVVTASATDFRALLRVIKKLDIPRLQVYVETGIIEVEVSDENNWGLNYGMLTGDGAFGGGFIGSAKNLAGSVGFPLGDKLAPGIAIPIFGPSFTSNIPGKAGAQPMSLMGLISILTANSKASVLSTPQIIALDNEKAVFKVEDKIPVVTGSSATTAALPGQPAVPSFNISRESVGIDITLTPHVNAKSKTIRLEIEQKVDSINNTQVPAKIQEYQVGTTSRVTNTQVVVKDRDFIALGGLMRDKMDENITKIPLLGDIPILGWLFKSRNAKQVKTNLIILLRPTIIGTSLEAATLVSEKMGARKEFIDKNLSGDDAHLEDIDKIKEQVKAQEERARKDGGFDYRKNIFDEDLDDEDKPTDTSDEPRTSETPPTNQLIASPPSETASSAGAVSSGMPGTASQASGGGSPPSEGGGDGATTKQN